MGTHAGLSWADVAALLIAFARDKPVTFYVTVVLPGFGVLGALGWFVYFMGAKRIQQMMNAYIQRIGEADAAAKLGDQSRREKGADK